VTIEQQKFLNYLVATGENLTKSWIDYWFKFSYIDTWQFWFNATLLTAPLILIYFLIDRKSALHIGFYGFNIHIWFTYVDTMGARFGFWSYPFQSIPLMPVNFGLDVSFIPVVYMLIYQYTQNHKKNYYLYTIGASILLAFALKPIFVALDLLQLHKGIGYIHLLISLLPVILLSKWITKLFIYFEDSSKNMKKA
jgi:hypothetical protein